MMNCRWKVILDIFFARILYNSESLQLQTLATVYGISCSKIQTRCWSWPVYYPMGVDKATIP